MIFTATHSSEIIKLVSFNLRHTVIENEDKYSSVLDLRTANDTEGVFIGDSISFYVDSDLIMTGTVDDVEQYRLLISREDVKLIDVKTSNHVIFYNKDNIRIAMDLSLKPFMNLVTDYHNINCDSVTHYYSDNAYTQVGY